MDEVSVMDFCQSLQDLFDDGRALVKPEDGVLPGGLVGVEVSSVAEFHNDEDPSLVYVE